jgi:hypothetical protein
MGAENQLEIIKDWKWLMKQPTRWIIIEDLRMGVSTKTRPGLHGQHNLHRHVVRCAAGNVVFSFTGLPLAQTLQINE